MSANPSRASYQTNIQAQRFTPSPFTDGAYQAHPQNPYQTQGPPPQAQQQQQTNPSQSLTNSAPQQQARLPTMAPPTAPPTPPTQQQQQQAPQSAQYAVQQGAATGHRNAPQYQRPQQQVPRRTQQQTPQTYAMYQTTAFPQQIFPQFIPSGHIRTQPMQLSAQPFSSPVYHPMTATQLYFNPQAPAFQQMAAPTTNGQRQTATPNPGPAPQSMGPASNEYQSFNVYDMPAVLPAPVTQPAPPKTTKKPGSCAIKIINPDTGKDIFEEDGNGTMTTSSGVGSRSSNNNISSSNSSISNSIGGSVGDEKATTADHHLHHAHHHSGKEESVEKENAEPLTPVVSAMSDGPSVDITPKHQVNKPKKIKPPEQIPSQQVQQISQSSSVQNSSQNQPSMVVPQLADPPKPIKIEAPIKQEIEQAPTQPVAIISQPVQDSENNNSGTIEIIQQQHVETEQIVSPPPSESQPIVEVNDINDTNNNNYQQQTKDDGANENEIANEPIESDETDRAVVIEAPQDTNNNSTETEEKIVSADGPINYDDDQWSPANMSGKKYYTRDQLLKLKDAIMVPPIRLPDGVANTLSKNNKEFLANTLTQVMPPMGMRTPFDAINSVAPKFMMNTPGNRNPYQTKRPSQSGNKQQVPGRGGSQSGPDRQFLKINLSLHDDVKLNESENAWKPTHLKRSDNVTEEEKGTNEVLSKFRSMLNKLTAENFSVLVEQVRGFKIDTNERLDGVINLLFEKAISEPKFAPTYAQLCSEIANIQTVPTGGSQDQAQDKQAKKASLKVKLITQCQKEFERNKEDTVKFREIEEKLRENESEPDNVKREETKAALEEEHYKLRQRANGTVKFIGELFKIEMLTPKIMRTCIEMLLFNEPTEEKVERICKLLTTIGSKMENIEGKHVLQKYFHILNEMTNSNNKIVRSSRIKFEIQNLQDLRNSGWKVRRQDAIPKTMDQLQFEAEQEQNLINYHTRQSVKEDRQRGGNQGYNKRQQPQQDSDGWSVQQNSKSRAAPIQLKNISLPSMSDSSAKLGQASQFQNFMMQTNKFAGLLVDGETEPPPRFGSGSKNSSMERGNSNSRFYGNGGDNRYGGRGSSNQNSRNSSQIRSRDNSDTRGGPSRSLQAPPRHQQQPMGGASMSLSGPAPVKKQSPIPVTLTADEVEKFLKEFIAIVDAYRDDKLTIEGVVEKANKVSINTDVLEQTYNKFLDRKDKDRENLMLVIVELIKQKLVIRDENNKALLKVMQFAFDIQCDVPRVYEYIAQFLSELLIANVLTFQEVYQICQADECNKENILRFIFSAIEKRHSPSKLQQVVAESNCDLDQFIKNGNFGRWLEENKFANMVRRGTRGIGDVMKNLEEMLQQKSTIDNIMNYISSTNCSTDPSFIRQLTLVVMTFCCDEYAAGQAQASYKLNNAKLEQLSLILQRYIDTDIERELQCISALQHFAFVREYPPGLLNSIFEILYDNDVLSVEAFEKWKNSEDASEGKGVAVCSTRQFFTKLAEDDDDDDDTGSN